MDIIVEHVSFTYPDKPVLHDISIWIPGEEITVITGVSGCGKTTLLKLIAGLLLPQSGTIQGGNKPGSENTGMVFQEDRLCENLSGALNIRIATGAEPERIFSHLRKVGLEKAEAEKKVLELSGGMKRRIAIVRAMLSPCRLLILDEPLKGLDQETKKMVLSYMKEMRNQRTMLYVTHDVTEAEELEAENKVVLSV